MKEITKEQIEQVVDKVAIEVTSTSYQDFLNAIEDIPEEFKNNPLAYNEVALAIAQNKTINIVKEVLKQLLV